MMSWVLENHRNPIPLIFLIWALDKVRMFLPSKRISPISILPGGLGTRRIIERAVTLFPLPDSPKMPNVSSSSLKNSLRLRPWPHPYPYRNKSLSRSF